MDSPCSAVAQGLFKACTPTAVCVGFEEHDNDAACIHFDVHDSNCLHQV
jgi:hypothetical protein